jgi:signal transduction histidine kinase
MRALRAGVDDFLEQPIDAAFLTARVATLLRLKRSRDDLALQHAELQRLQEEQRRLLDFVARDMTAPARTLASAVDRLEAGGEATTITAPVAHMRRALHHLFAMVDDLIWVSRLENAATPVRRDVVALDRLVERVTAGFAARATERGIRLECASRPRVAVPADETLVARVLENLLDNALRYAPEGGGVRVDLRRDRGAEIRVCNDGPAIAPVERRRIFRKFERGVTDPPSAGHPGLGLYFCKRVVDAHQGEIAVVDVPEWSTCFSVWLPEATPARVAAPSPSQDLGP